MKVLVCGGRGYSDGEHIYAVLHDLHKELVFTHVIHGAAPGADQFAGTWANRNGVQVVSCPANWDVHKRAAGYLRNVAMADLGPDLVVAFPGNVGTAMMIQIAEKRGIQVVKA